MATTGHLDLSRLGLRPGASWSGEVELPIGTLTLGGAEYRVSPDPAPARLTVDAMTHGRALRLAFDAAVDGPCQRCLADTHAEVHVDGRAISGAGRRGSQADPELETPYVEDDMVDLPGWGTEELVLALPSRILCADDCKGLCAACGADLNDTTCDCHDERTDPRWDVLRQLNL
jgi:uncharacterized protein